MSDSVWPHRRQPTRLPCPWDSPGSNTGVGCRFLLQCMKVKSESEVAQSCLTRSGLMDCSPPGSSNHGIFQARVLEWGAIAFPGIVLLPLLSHFSRVRLCAIPSLGFSRQEHWSGLPFPSPSRDTRYHQTAKRYHRIYSLFERQNPFNSRLKVSSEVSSDPRNM